MSIKTAGFRKPLLNIFCIVLMGLSFLAHVYLNHLDMEKILAPIHINVEILKSHAPAVSIAANDERLYYPKPTGYNDLEHTVLYQKIPEDTWIQALFLRLPDRESAETIDAIDNLSVFIGSKVFYYSAEDVRNFESSREDGYRLLRLPAIYQKTLLKDWVNWYGYYNFFVRVLCDLLFFPVKYLFVYLFLALLALLNRDRIAVMYKKAAAGRHAEVFMVILIALFGFMLRINGFVRYSAWYDEFFSSCTMSSPHIPLAYTFYDPGNPPFYFLLLRFWFALSGWTEESGRLLSVLLGTAAILSMYLFVRAFAGKRAALLAALFSAVSTHLVGYSQEIRCYILLIFLVPLTSYFFLRLLKNGGAVNAVSYTVLGIFVANTHYFGVIFIMANFVFYVLCMLKDRERGKKKILFFFLENIVIGVSFLPYFLLTSLNQALLDTGFNTQISKPTLEFYIAFLCIAGFLLLFLYFKKRRTPLFLGEGGEQTLFFDYTLVTPAFIFLIAFVFSFLRPVISWKYLVVCLPFIMIAVSLAGTDLVCRRKFVIPGIVLSYAFLIVLYQAEPGGNYDVYKANQIYITSDIEAHPQRSASLIGKPEYIDFYRLPRFPLYTKDGGAGLVYINPVYADEQETYEILARSFLDDSGLLKIISDDRRVIFKKFLRR
ncbi:MAG: glycosyltransferase family 39 protein [Treponema sp.]|nr:glycosyltransferase family 39 protein [Treponema sp.]